MIMRFITSTAILIMTLMLTHMPAYAETHILLQDVKNPNTADGFFMFQSKGADYSIKSPYPISEGYRESDDETGSPEMYTFFTEQELFYQNKAFGGGIIFKNEKTKNGDQLKQFAKARTLYGIEMPEIIIHNIPNGKAGYFESHNDKIGIIGIIFESDTKIYRVLCIYPIENKEDHSRCDVAIDSFQINGMTKIDWASLK